ncbi:MULTISPECIES: hypothetical protein [Spirulina sp. CCY15215]|uniref:hypothetical protein n=1 Tax=Spirulina sp. CCY15215 TaxID=2767591 RepID=UPI00194EAA3E|nr:hypothetical protein [Spirulina major]
MNNYQKLSENKENKGRKHCVENKGRKHCVENKGRKRCVENKGRKRCVENKGRKHCAPTVKMLLVACCLLPVAFWNSPARSEGSLELTANGGDRPFLNYTNDVSGGVPFRTSIKVFARVGEVINLASSALGFGSAAINYRAPDGASGTFTTGCQITNRLAETSKSYTPCTVTVGAGQEGIWEIDFISPNPTAVGSAAANPTAIAASNNWPTQDGNDGFVTAWDVTVTNGGVDQSGRVYANYFPWNMGSNGRSLNSEVVVLTDQGFQYQIDLNGIDPFGFIFFANNKGFRDSSGEPIFRSLQFSGLNPGTIPPGFSIHLPSAADTSDDITQKLFINSPDTSMPSSASSPSGTTWLYQAPIIPSPPSNFQFRGVNGTSGLGLTSPAGGEFTFTNNGTTGTYTIILDLNQNDILGDGNDRVLIGRSPSGTNIVTWDGLDSNGDIVPASDVTYKTELVTSYGEVHFPMFDPENNPNGLIIQRLSPTTAPPDPFNIYYDDANTGTDYTLCASGETGDSTLNCSIGGTPPNPRFSLLGTSSAGGAHAWSNNFGNIRGMDTWVNFPLFPALEGTFAISDGTTAGTSNLRIVKRITNITRNGSAIAGVDFSSFVDDSSTTNDNAAGWSSLSPIGIINLPQSTPLTSGDEVEYTLYLLSDGDATLANVNICDPIPQETTFVNDTYGSGRGILLRQGSSEASQTNNALDTDTGKFFTALTPVAIDACPNANNPNGSVVIEGLSLSNTASENVGFVRFRVTVN